MSTNAESNIELRLSELKNVCRLISNTFNLICDVEVKGGHATAVAEILGWLNGFRKSIESQITALETALPKPEPVKAVELEAVKG